MLTSRMEFASAEGGPDFDSTAGAEIEIEHRFRQRLTGLRYRPQRERAAIVRAARIERQQALSALHERRATDRHAQRWLRRLQRPVPT